MITLKRAVLVLGILLVVLGTIAFVGSEKGVSKEPVEVTQEATATGQITNETLETSRVVRVIDGDTIELEGGKRVRYIGMDTPELYDPRKPVGPDQIGVECFGQEAKDENIKLVEGKEVRLVKDVSETDKYNRLLRYVYIGDVFVNDYLVRQGFAHASTFPPDVRFADQFLAAQKEARENNRGLWSGCTLGISPTIEQFNNGTITPTISGASGACAIKGNISTSGEKIYHVPGCGSYAKTAIDESAGERWFCSESEAVTAGWRKAKNCPP